jgi:hypothetical protein
MYLQRSSLPIVAFALLGCAAASMAAETSIVVDTGPYLSAEVAGHDEAHVDWSDAASSGGRACTECFAALELQTYLRKMTGRTSDFAIAKDSVTPSGDLIIIGVLASNASSRHLALQMNVTTEQVAAMGPEGYRIRSRTVDGRHVWLIVGGSRSGTLYGVYDFLHRLGCRWFAPGELHEEIPRVEQIPAIDADERPSFLSRGFHAWEDRGTPEFLLWMARNRLNYWCVEQTGHPLMRKLGIHIVCGQHDAEVRFLNPDSQYPYRHVDFQGNQYGPEDPYPVSPQYLGDANHDGKLSYFEAHPEWYATQNGRRVPGFHDEWGANYCTSNTDATSEFMKNYVHALVDGPYRDADVVRLWTLDGGKWCECSNCRALGTPTDRNLLLVFRLDQEIKKARAAGKIRRPVQINFLAYADVLAPPTRPLPPAFDNATCVAEFYPITRCYVHNFDDPACGLNHTFVDQLRGWALAPARHYRGTIAIGEYYNVSGYKSLPVCFMHTMANDIPYYYRCGARHFDYMHVTVSNWGTKSLTNWQMARQLWNVNTGCEALWRDYFARRYGPAAESMRSFYESLESMLSNATLLKYTLAGQLTKGAEDLFPHPHLRYQREPGRTCQAPTLVEIGDCSVRCRKLIDQVRGRELPPRIMQRVEEDAENFQYSERTIAYYIECVRAFQLARAGHRDEARLHYDEARRVANLLRNDTESVKYSSSHANAADALDATGAAKALDHLAELLAPVEDKR